MLLFCTQPDHASNPRLTARWTLLQQHVTGNTQVFVVVPPHPLFFSLHLWCPSCAIHHLFFLIPCSHHSKHNQSEAKQKLLAKWWVGGGGSCSCKMLLRSIAQFLTCSAPSSPGSKAVEADDRPGSSILSSLNPRLSWPVVQNLSQKFVRRCNPSENRQLLRTVCAHCSQKRLVCTKKKHPNFYRLFPLSTFFHLGQI